MRLRALVLSAAVVLPAVAHADVQHTVARGHTIEAIANRYHVTPKQIIDANHLKDVKKLQPGDVLTIPTKDKPKAKTESKSEGGKKSDSKSAKADKAHSRETTTYAMKAKTPGVIHVHRVATNESYDIRVSDKKTRVSPTTLKTFEKMMRSPSGMAHPIEPRLVALLGVMSNHFGSRKIEVVSGFRPFSPTQYTPHSNHNHGKAIDFRVVGVPNEAVRDFCRTLKNTGCGYYPNSVFVHMDARDSSAFWIDYSKPGEPPRYNAPNVEADEGASDVHDESHAATGSTPDSKDSNGTANTPPPSDTPTPAPESPKTEPTTPPAKPETTPAPKTETMPAPKTETTPTTPKMDAPAANP
jgi:uncharacterized protein YcbK (DUF882 family)